VIRKLALIAAAMALLAVPARAVARLPAGFIGISPQGVSSGSDFELMAESGVTSVRLPLSWAAVEPLSPYLVAPDWSDFDRSVALAAEHGIRIFPFVSGTAAWVAGSPSLEPADGHWARGAWASFLRAAVRRYGPGGDFWSENPDLPYLPIRDWEIWNEPNIVSFGSADPERFARLIRTSGRVLHRADPGSKVIVGGLFGRPLQSPPNVPSGAFLARLYRAGNVKRFFDGVALHPYVATVRAMGGQIRNLRRIMRIHHDAATPLYLTELGWGSDSFESRWERGWWGQAEELDHAFALLAGHRRAWRIGGVWWFSWTDAGGYCQFCDSAGLLTENREAKPAWYRFNAWTGGDPDTVLRAPFAG
jgi:polysaccharide biosynthesis protein PslG